MRSILQRFRSTISSCLLQGQGTAVMITIRKILRASMLIERTISI
jgi:hypothetical protein